MNHVRFPVVNGMKRCTVCLNEKPTEAFNIERRRGREQFMSRCKACHKDYRQVWYTQRGGIEVTRSYQRRRRYGISASAWRSLFDAQGGRCAICREEPTATLHTDHGHECCGAKRGCSRCIRGLVCNACNITIGQVENAMRRGWCTPTGTLASYLASPPWQRLRDAVGVAAPMIGGRP